ncbi:MAG: hypothetical protein P4K97_01355 [Terracidiphilus sp.]|nr:hypothetical protein [Terracidiphilus sp.]
MQPEGVFARGDHGHGDRFQVGLGVEIFGFQPGAQPGIVDLGLALPEIRSEAALDLQMIQLQLNHRNAPGKVTADVADADVEPGDNTALAMGFDYHKAPAIPLQMKQV